MPDALCKGSLRPGVPPNQARVPQKTFVRVESFRLRRQPEAHDNICVTALTSLSS